MGSDVRACVVDYDSFLDLVQSLVLTEVIQLNVLTIYGLVDK